jgi:hypothetical protein
MRKRIARAIVLCLSSIALLSILSFPVHAQTQDDSEGLVLVTVKYDNESRFMKAGQELESSKDDEETKQAANNQKEITIEDEEVPLGITVAGLLARGKWFIGLGGIALTGVAVISS